MLSCYDGLFPAMKKSGEWTIYLERDCAYLDRAEGKCAIHTEPHQSLICKSYNARKCWYVDAFNREKFTTMIRFNTSMLLWYEKRYDFIRRGFDTDPDWDELCAAALEFRSDAIDMNSPAFVPWTARKLSFRDSRSERFLFLPPYNRPVHISHFELLSFRLGFPGIYLAVSDSCWGYLISTGLNMQYLDLIRSSCYPALEHKDGSFSFNEVMKGHHPFSESGDQWVILRRADIPLLKSLTLFNDRGDVRRLPRTAELLDAFKTASPDRAA